MTHDDDATCAAATVVVGAAAALGFGSIDPGEIFDLSHPGIQRLADKLKAMEGTPELEGLRVRRRRKELTMRETIDELIVLVQRFDLATATFRPPST